MTTDYGLIGKELLMLKSVRLGVALLTLCSFALFATAVFANGPIFWEVSKQDEVLKGDARGVSIADNGAMSLAPSYTLVYDTKEAYIWSATTDTGGIFYRGTDQDGKIFKVATSGNGRLLYDAPHLDVTALATDAKGTLYAATSPDGKIYKITADGNATVLFKPPYKYVW